MLRINISISKEHLAIIDKQARKEGRSRSAHIVELAKDKQKGKAENE